MLTVAMAQLDPMVGDVRGNTELMLEAWRRAAERGADLVVFTELAVVGYPPEDLLLKPAFLEANLEAVERLAAEHPRGCAGIVGHVAKSRGDERQDEWDVTVPARQLRNAASVIVDGRVVGTYHKWRLPNYGVFDEARYFVPDDDPLTVPIAGVGVGVIVCEDLWAADGAAAAAVHAGAEVLVVPNASPFQRSKRVLRERWARHHATRRGVPVVYVNQVGGQDDVVFDGDSFVMGPDGDVVARAAQFAPDLVLVDLDAAGRVGDRASADRPPPRLDPVTEVWEALVLGVRDYVRKNGFERAVIGLSGGIDSAVTTALAVDALGPDQITAVALPSPYTSTESLVDARALADNLKIRYEEIPITPAMEAFDGMLADLFADTEPDTTEENLQARIRGAVLMALSNKFGWIVLATGNKSEYAVGYATLYGDMVGGFAVLKDVPKTLVYDLARHRNGRTPETPPIPQRVLDKPPSAELRPGQRDTDALPPYEVLDPIVEAYVEHDASYEDLVAAGHDPAIVRDVLERIDRAEYKRRQAPPGVKITARAFGKERRVPITTAWRG